MNHLKSYLKTQQELINNDLEVFLNTQTKLSSQIDPILTELLDRSNNLFLSGGKRLRPILVKLGFDLAGGAKEGSIVRASLFAELIHSYILVHDDIADRDYLRYSKPTLQVEFEQQFKEKFGHENSHFGISIAMVAGDLIQTLAHQALLSSCFEAEKLIKAEALMNHTLQEVVAGWYIHQLQNHQALDQADLERYLDGMKLVSASYTIKSPLLLGNLLSDSPIANTNYLETYAYHTGMAFQIQDDILGVFGDSKTTGKPAGNDLREGKKTTLVLHAYSQANKKEKEFLYTNIGQDLTEEQVEDLKQIIINTGSLEHSQNLAKEHVANAQKVLEKLPERANPQVIEILGQIAEFVLIRKF